MRTLSQFILSLCITCLATLNLANANEELNMANHDYIQAIQITNYLADTTTGDTGITPTAVNVEYYINSVVCWKNKLDYQDDVTIHAGPSQGCKTKVTKIVVTPLPVFDKLKVYAGAQTVTIGPADYVSQIIIVQDTAPVFDSHGSVVTPGTLKIQKQSQVQ
jgi:hypothetical protein